MPAATIEPIRVCELTYPPSHPEGPGDGELFAFLIRQGSTSVLVDTGIGTGYALIDERFHPRRVDLTHELARRGVDARNLTAIVCSHLHFDHCGNNRLFAGIPIYVQRSEYDAAGTPRYTVNEWVSFAGADYRLLEGSIELAAGINIVATPGHTPGHQSVAVDTPTGVEIIVAQAAYTAAEFDAYRGTDVAVRDDVWSKSAYETSLRRLHAMSPARAYFSHDATVWCAPRGRWHRRTT